MTQVTSVDAYWLGKRSLLVHVMHWVNETAQLSSARSSTPSGRRTSTSAATAARPTASSRNAPSSRRRWRVSARSACSYLPCDGDADESGHAGRRRTRRRRSSRRRRRAAPRPGSSSPARRSMRALARARGSRRRRGDSGVSRRRVVYVHVLVCYSFGSTVDLVCVSWRLRAWHQQTPKITVRS
jgi:hypothetical protein